MVEQPAFSFRALFALVLCLGLTIHVNSQSSTNLVPSFEVKLLLNSAIALTPNHEPIPELLSLFDIATTDRGIKACGTL